MCEVYFCPSRSITSPGFITSGLLVASVAEMVANNYSTRDDAPNFWHKIRMRFLSCTESFIVTSVLTVTLIDELQCRRLLVYTTEVAFLSPTSVARSVLRGKRIFLASSKN